jgi:hypothetical protein
VTCSGETIPLSLVTQVYSDVMSDNWLDLATNVIPLLKDGYADIECIFGYLGTSNPETVPHIKAMKAQHADEFKGSVSMRHPSLTFDEQAAIHIPLPPVQHAPPIAFCDRACGKPRSGLSTPSGCLCWRESKTDWRQSRWVRL